MRSTNTAVHETPSDKKIESFWKERWNLSTIFNEQAKWLTDLKQSCRNFSKLAKQIISLYMVSKAINRIQINKLPGGDRIAGHWLYFSRPRLYTSFHFGNSLKTNQKWPRG